MKISFVIITWLLLFSSHLAFSQTTTTPGYFGIRAGYQRVATDIAISTIGGVYNSRGIAPRSTFYGGGFYQQSLNRWLVFRLELNYQQKGLEYLDQNVKPTVQQRLHYVGLTPLIGINPLPNLSVLIGPEGNQLVKDSSPSPTNEIKSIELGLTARISYTYKWIGLEAGYFKAFTGYQNLKSVDFESTSKNRSWQVGLLVIPAKFKAGK
ncbi:PorT family protein [Spirosoma sp. BT702]|uniref:PorT family protein n=1 Tax=Spirosoma profusum TaxID=2771354 RepID=A0A927GAS7_9BACT|nr:outer membrane beta-barrel protein [Spirosoma profusum]MBD2705787.1 PorT family protein [Spirosoma profusum]